jgi:hypothetical protein
MSYIISQRRLLLMALKNINNLTLSISMRDDAVRWGVLRLSRTNGPLGGRRHGSTARYPCMLALREGNPCTLFVRT